MNIQFYRPKSWLVVYKAFLLCHSTYVELCYSVDERTVYDKKGLPKDGFMKCVRVTLDSGGGNILGAHFEDYEVSDKEWKRLEKLCDARKV